MRSSGGRPISVLPRAIAHQASHAIRDVYDAISELVTNADDRYQVLRTDGTIEIEISRRRSRKRLLRVRDFADGMDRETMDRKIGQMGGRDSGLDGGEDVRGTHSRGAKDVAALGRVVFESVAQDGHFHCCEITPGFMFKAERSVPASPEIREKIGIAQGTGTLVTIELLPEVKLPQHDTLLEQVARLVSIRRVVTDPRRRISLRDLARDRKDSIVFPQIDGTDRVKETFEIPGYPGIHAKLIISRAKRRFERMDSRFRLGGILVQSRRAVHQATLFDSGLEADPHALWFYGRLTCDHIDELCRDYDDRLEQGLQRSSENPRYVLDPSRRAGLAVDHPFITALFGEALKRLRPLVEEERKREEHAKETIESRATRKRLDALERALQEFMGQFDADDEISRSDSLDETQSRFMQRGYRLSPPFAQMIVGNQRDFWFTVRQDAFPELQVGSTVQIEDLSVEIESGKRYCGLQEHPTQRGILQATWKVRAVRPTTATGIRVRCGSIVAESIVEIVASDADLYRHITQFCFARKRYSMRTNQRSKKVILLAPIGDAPTVTAVEMTSDSPRFRVTGERLMRPVERLGVSRCELNLRSDGHEATSSLVARLGGQTARAEVSSHAPLGAGITIRLEDIDLGNQRYRWRQDVLEIAGRHPSLRRYLGDGFRGQEEKYFRVLIAEIVAEAACARAVRSTVRTAEDPREFEGADWDQYYALYCKFMTEFLPIAHRTQVSDL